MIKFVAAALLGLAAICPQQAQAEVDADLVAQVQLMTRDAKNKGLWAGDMANITVYAQVKNKDAYNRIFCSMAFTYNMAVIFKGGPKAETQLVHMVCDEDAKKISAKEVETIDPAAGGTYILFTPTVLYVLDYTNAEAPKYYRYAKRK